MTLAAPTVKLHGYGAIKALAHCRDPRILIEGGANSGKTSGICRIIEWHCWAHPGIRVLFCRQTMQSLRESIMVTLEEKVWAPMMGGRRHPAMSGTASRGTRRTYQYPNGSVIVIGGLEDPGWTFSMEYDLIVVFEAWEISRDSMEKLYRANRNHMLCRFNEANKELAASLESDWNDERWLRGHQCWQQIIADTNPHSEFHWLNQIAAPIGGEEVDRIKSDQLPSRRVFRSPDHPFTRILSRHVDNPACTKDDLTRLRALTGHRYVNLYLALWASAVGQIWPSFDPTVHMQTGRVSRDGDMDPACMKDGKFIAPDRRLMYLELLGERGPHLPAKMDVKWAFASMDFGYRKAGCGQVWLVDNEDRMYRAVEIYRCEMMDDWWAEKFIQLCFEFNLHAIVCDSEDPERVVKFNDRLSNFKNRNGQAIAQGVDKSVRRGNRSRFVTTKLDLVRDMLAPDQVGGPRMYWLRDALREGRDPICKDKMLPTCSEEEIPSYVFPEHKDGKEDSEEPDDACEDHGCDAAAYAAVYKWLMDPVGIRQKDHMPIGTAGWRMGHKDVLRKSRKWQR